MRGLIVAAIAIGLWISARTAVADDAAKKSPPRPDAIVPSIDIRHASNDAKISLGAEGTFEVGDNSDLAVGATFLTKTHGGVLTLFDEDAGRDYSLALHFSLVELRDLEEGSDDFRAKVKAKITTEFGKCVEACKNPPASTEGFCLAWRIDELRNIYAAASGKLEAARGLTKTLETAATAAREAAASPTATDGQRAAVEPTAAAAAKALADEVPLRAEANKHLPPLVDAHPFLNRKGELAAGDARKLCPGGNEAIRLLSEERTRDRRARPLRLYSFGLSLGATPGEGDAPAFSVSTFAASLTMLFERSALTLELPLRAGLRAEVADDQPGGCRETAGAATACEVLSADTSLLLGVAPSDLTSFRMAFGPGLKVSAPDNAQATIEASLRLPIYLNTNLPIFKAEGFKGILRVTPSIVRRWDRETNTKDNTVLVNLEFLTGTSMFTSALSLL